MIHRLAQIAAQRVRRLFRRRRIEDATEQEWAALKTLCGLLDSWLFLSDDDASRALWFYVRALGPLKQAIVLNPAIVEALDALADGDPGPRHRLKNRPIHQQPHPYRLVDVKFPSRDGLLHVTPASIAANSKGR